LGIQSLADVALRKASFINRPRGSGTHLALDTMLQDGGIDKSDINGYYTEEFTHSAVAAAVAAGVADVGLGIEAAARKLTMDFVPLFSEDYYLLAKRETIEREDIANIIAVLKDQGISHDRRRFPRIRSFPRRLGRHPGRGDVAIARQFGFSAAAVATFSHLSISPLM
jgi:molybdate-binding protein